MRLFAVMTLAVCSCFGASLTVTVEDPTGAVVPGATVTAGRAKATTGDDGRAVFASIPAGRTQVHAEALGFTPRTVTQTLRNGENTMKIELAVAAHKDEVTADVDPVEEKLDSRGGSFSTTLTPDQIAQLPDDPDEMQQVLSEMAGPGASFRVNGFSGGRLPSKSQIASIRIRQSPFTAEEHDLGFALVDITTKPGLGSWHGSGLFGYGGDELNARNPLAATQEPQQNRRVELTLNGPLRKNKTSISGSFTHAYSFDSSISNGLTLSGPFRDTVRLPLDTGDYQTRLIHALTPKHQLRGEYQFYETKRAAIGSTDLPERLATTVTKNNTLRLSDLGPVSEKVLNEVRFQSIWSSVTTTPTSTAPAVVVPGAFSSGGAASNSYQKSNSSEFRDDLSTSTRKNAVRFGVQADALGYTSQNLGNANGTFTFADLAAYQAATPLTYTQLQGSARIRFDEYEVGAYIQDDYRLRKNLSVTGGVRWEAQTHATHPANFDPRVGFTWSPLRKGSMTVRGGAGIFRQWIDPGVIQQSLLLNGFNQSDLVIQNPGYPNPFAGGFANVLPPGIYRLAPDIRTPYLLRASLNIQQEAGRVMITAGARYEHGVGLIWNRNINAPVAGIGRPLPQSGNIFEIGNYGESLNKAFTFGMGPALGKNPGRTSFWFFSYMLSSTINDADNALAAPSNNFNLRADRGYAANDARHRLNGSYNTRLPLGFQIAAFGAWNSGLPYNITTGFDNNGDTIINDRPTGVARNSARARGTVMSSLRLSWSKDIGQADNGGMPNVVMVRAGGDAPSFPNLRKPGEPPPKYEYQVYVQAYNLLNHANESNYIGVLNSPLYGQPTTAQAGRRIEIGTKFTW